MKLTTASCALALVFFIAGCRRTAPAISPPSATAPRDIPEIYQPLFNGGRRPTGQHFGSQEELAQWFAQLPFASITLERSPCYGPCPVYRFSMHRDGQAEFEAVRYLPDLGKFSGRVELSDYARLCYLLEQLHFMSLAPAYEGGWTDDVTVTITTTGPDHEKVVSEYGATGPIELWTLQQTIESLRHNIDWQSK